MYRNVCGAALSGQSRPSVMLTITFSVVLSPSYAASKLVIFKLLRGCKTNSRIASKNTQTRDRPGTGELCEQSGL